MQFCLAEQNGEAAVKSGFGASHQVGGDLGGTTHHSAETGEVVLGSFGMIQERFQDCRNGQYQAALFGLD